MRRGERLPSAWSIRIAVSGLVLGVAVCVTSYRSLFGLIAYVGQVISLIGVERRVGVLVMVVIASVVCDTSLDKVSAKTNRLITLVTKCTLVGTCSRGPVVRLGDAFCLLIEGCVGRVGNLGLGVN